MKFFPNHEQFNIPLLLLLVWAVNFFLAPSPTWVHAVAGLIILAFLLFERFIAWQTSKKLKASELERITKLEAEVSNIITAFSTQRTMF